MHRVRRVFIEALGLNIGQAELPYGDTLDEVAGLDSIAILEFVSALEEEFGIAIEPQLLQFDFLRDLPRLASYIEERTAGGRSDP